MQIHWTHFDEVAQPLRDKMEARLRALGDEQGDLIDVRLVAHSTEHHRHGARHVRITCQANGRREIVASSEATELSLALTEAVDAFEREVRKLREKRQSAR